MIPNPTLKIGIDEFTRAHEQEGSLKRESEEEKLMKSVLQNEKKTIQQGKIVSQASNMGISNFNPDMMFRQITKNYALAEQMYGESLVRMLTGHNPSYLRKNINIPEFQREIAQSIRRNIENLGKTGIIDKKGNVTDKGVTLSALLMLVEELDNIIPKGNIGKRFHKKPSSEGEITDVFPFRKGARYRDIALQRSLRKAVMRGRIVIRPEDIQVNKKENRGNVEIIYGIDASGSMKGKKIETAKKAGIALAYKAIENKDKVGLIVFGSDIRQAIAPTQDFFFLLKALASTKASRETDFVQLIRASMELFSGEGAKHLVVVSDALPTVGDKPEQETLEAVAAAKSLNITISLIGINLTDNGVRLGEKIAEMGEGRLYQVRNLEELDLLVIEEYYSAACAE